jgi:hypothetical protein
MKVLYKPFGIIAGMLGARIGQTVFKSVWAKVDHSEPPPPKAPEASLGKVVAASALEAATLAGVGTAVDRLGMRWFEYLTGIWPGDKPAEATGQGGSAADDGE